MNQGYSGANPSAEKPREPTLNERLNKVSERMQFDFCERLESVLGRINGNPTPKTDSVNRIAQIQPTLPLATVVEHLEAVQSRLAALAASIERIA